MTTHYLTPVGLSVAHGWQPLETIPKDGTIVEVQDAEGFICKAQWHSERVLPASLKMVPVSWRHLE